MANISKLLLILFFLVLLLPLLLERPSVKMTFGVTFSPKYAHYMKLDWKKVYLDILDNLQIRQLRLVSYWDGLQKEEAKIDFSETDYLLNEANLRGAKVILVLGERQPRWPECHIPSWAGNLSLDKRQEKLLEFMRQVLMRYKDNPAIWAWQVENEQLLTSFGEGCSIPSIDFLKKEINLVRNESQKPIIMTDSGELGFWKTSMSLSDIFGTTLYRQVYDPTFGYISYPLPPYFYSLKSNIIRSLFVKENKRTIIVELQAEPWLKDGVSTGADEQAKIFTINDFKNYLDFAKKTGFDEAYLWGAEWWYFMAQNGHPEYLQYAKNLF